MISMPVELREEPPHSTTSQVLAVLMKTSKPTDGTTGVTYK